MATPAFDSLQLSYDKVNSSVELSIIKKFQDILPTAGSTSTSTVIGKNLGDVANQYCIRIGEGAPVSTDDRQLLIGGVRSQVGGEGTYYQRIPVRIVNDAGVVQLKYISLHDA